MNVKDVKLNRISKELANYFNKDNEAIACACLGVSCGNVKCSLFWELFIKKYDIPDLIKMFLAIKEK